jgi:UPF0042 nucleotide-binding protein
MQQLHSFLQQNNITYNSIEALPASGGGRQYFRVYTNDKPLIAAVANLLGESETFFSFTNTFNELKLPVPKIIAISNDHLVYLQEDLGTICLLDKVLENGHTQEVFNLYKNALQNLAKLQIYGHSKIDYTKCLGYNKFDAHAAYKDINYFIEHFVNPLNIDYDAENLNIEMLDFCAEINEIEPIYFMYRDFQGRNIMVHNNDVFFIDYQGGMQGPLQYDLASLLWQAKAQLPMQWKIDLYNIYLEAVQQIIPITNTNVFKTQYAKLVLLRLMQVLGAYGLRGLKEGKPHFISSIPSGIHNLEIWFMHFTLEPKYINLLHIIQQIIFNKNKFNSQY